MFKIITKLIISFLSQFLQVYPVKLLRTDLVGFNSVYLVISQLIKETITDCKKATNTNAKSVLK